MTYDIVRKEVRSDRDGTGVWLHEHPCGLTLQRLDRGQTS